MDEKVRQIKFEADNNTGGEYEVEAIWDTAVYIKESKSGHLPGLYYLVLWKGYSEKGNTWEPASTFQHLRKLISSFHKNYPDKPTMTFLAIDTALLIVRPTVELAVKPTEPPKRKQGRPTHNINKWAKKNLAAFDFYYVFGRIRVISTLNISQPHYTWLHVTARDCMWLHVTACDCTWLPANFHQNFYFLTFKSYVWLDFFSLLCLSHKASLFFLELLLD